MKYLVYTCVFAGYDRIYPPVTVESGIDYVVITDDASLRVSGWQTFLVDSTKFATPKSGNLYYRALSHRLFLGYDASLYVDGNVRVKGLIRPLIYEFLCSGSAIGAYHHPLRNTVASEVEVCVSSGKVYNSTVALSELADYIERGFTDDQGLVETTILLKNHSAADLDEGMSLWASLYSTYLTRDQFSVPFVLWKTGMTWHRLPGTLRVPNDHFAIYPHLRAPNTNPLYLHVSARSNDNFFYRILLYLWELNWKFQRILRRIIK